MAATKTKKKKFVKDPAKLAERTARRIALLDQRKAFLEEMEACKTDEEKQQRIPFQEIIAMIERIMANKEDKKPYSTPNFILIYFQKSDASWLHTFKGWLDLGYCVKKDEQGIEILAPHEMKKANEDDQDELAKMGFHFVNVFDYSQVQPLEGREVTPPEVVEFWASDDSLNDLPEVVQVAPVILSPYQRMAALLRQEEGE